MPVSVKKNPFRGINPHLNSYLQDGHWETFQSRHVVHLSEALEEQLPPNCASSTEESLQIKVIRLPEEVRNPSRIEPDVLVMRESLSSSMTADVGAGAPTLILPLIELEVEIDDEPMPGIVIYELVERGERTPVTRIELLSSANKPYGSHYSTYREKRLQTLKAGLNLVELDYLHETPPISPRLLSYRAGQAGAFPYYVIVSRPHPTYDDGQATIYGIRVDESLPTIRLPLAGEEAIEFDLDERYQHTALTNRIFRDGMDYTRLPRYFERYQPADQERIQAIMQTALAESELQP